MSVRRVRGPSPNLSWIELACKDGTSYPEEWRGTRALCLANVFEEIRHECGNKPLHVFSAFRTATHNKKIGGARYSQHLQGRALDLRPPSGWSIQKFYDRIADLDIVGGLGKYQTFVHVDVRSTDRLARWTGTGVKDAKT
jgi:uncharacterized protein YcbK (DUF882 family)